MSTQIMLLQRQYQGRKKGMEKKSLILWLISSFCLIMPPTFWLFHLCFDEVLKASSGLFELHARARVFLG
jgi:hypothetical protein